MKGIEDRVKAARYVLNTLIIDTNKESWGEEDLTFMDALHGAINRWDAAKLAKLPKCELCGGPMPPGEEMFRYHGHSAPCPPPEVSAEEVEEAVDALRAAEDAKHWVRCRGCQKLGDQRTAPVDEMGYCAACNAAYKAAFVAKLKTEPGSGPGR